MEKHQFEETLATLSTIVCLLAHYLNIEWLFYIFLFKNIFDWYCALYESYKQAKQDLKNK
jgi:membrane protein CcdC involved in cytochrome C biogenesis